MCNTKYCTVPKVCVMKKDDFIEYLLNDVLREMDGVVAKRMFGGFGLFKEEVMFALVFGGQLYFKVGQKNQADYEAVGSKPFSYKRAGKKVSLSYWRLPIEIQENPQEAVMWAHKSFLVAKNK